MNAVILAAGRGSRLGERSNGLPKCLLRFGGLSILEHQIASLRSCGIREIAVVVGYRAVEIQRRLGHSVRYVYNAIYPSTNSLYSLWLARHHLGAGFLLMNGDVLFHPEVLRRLIASPYPDAVAIQRKSQFEEEEMKVQLRGDRILTISKKLSVPQAHGESLGIAKFSPDGSEGLVQAMERLIRNGGRQDWAPRAFDAMAPHYPIFCCDVEKLPWIEIDFPHDLDVATTAVWPKIYTAREADAAA